MASEEIVDAVASGASIQADASIATVEVQNVSTTEAETSVAVIKSNGESDDKKFSGTSTASVTADGTEKKGNGNPGVKKVQKGQKTIGTVKGKKGKKPATAVVAAAQVLTPGDDKGEADKNEGEVDGKEEKTDGNEGVVDTTEGEVQKKEEEADKNEGEVDAKEGEAHVIVSNVDKAQGDTVKEEKSLSKKAKKRRVGKQVVEAASKENAGDAVAGSQEAGTPASKKVEKHTGLIFMCNAKTKADCFKYQIFGLPEGKKDTVAKVYKGMTLFLYDFDLKLLYGIYRAASPGGYNLQPKAFNSDFPAQVRFAVVDDCKPLGAEKFREAIKANYYGRNKFNVQLTDDQVKALCKLFRSGSKGSKLNSEADTPSLKKQGKKRASQNENQSSRKSSDAKRRRISKPVQRPLRSHVLHVSRIPARGHEIRERSAYLAPQYSRVVPEPHYAPEPVYASEPGYAPSYAYERPARFDYYRREEPSLEIPSYMLPDSRPDVGYRSYNLRRETAPYNYRGSRGLSDAYVAAPFGYRY